MTRFLVILLAGALSAKAAESQTGAASYSGAKAGSVFFVATNGNDSWSGTLSSPNARVTDGPFRSLQQAVQAVRNSRHEGNRAQRASIYIREGLHLLADPLVLSPEDSGIAIESFKQEKPILSGGARITGWRKVLIEGRELWAAAVPAVRGHKPSFHEFWVNGTRAIRARHPNKGYFAIAEVPDKSAEWTQGHARFRFREKDLRAWNGATNGEVVVMSRWVESRLPISRIDEEQRLVSFAKKSVFELGPGDLYYVENVVDLLDQPGEWSLDSSSGTVYYLARPGEQIDRCEGIFPVLPQVLRFEGKPDSGEFLERITVRGLTFSHTEWCFPEGFQSNRQVEIFPAPKPDIGGFAQAAIGVPGAVWGEGVRLCSIENCTFASLGTYGLELGRACQSNRISHCEFADLGAGGIKIGETRIRQDSAQQAGHNSITDCMIHDGGKIFASAIGVWIGQSSDNLVSHNLIYDFFYTGISIGWTWGYGASLASNNLVEFNHVHHIGRKSDGDGPILSDMGGIYTLGKQPGTRILNNLWHDIAGIQYGGWGIYLDEGSSGILVQSNVVYRTTHGGFHQHYGETNILENNLFAYARDHQIQRTRPEPHSSFSFQTNIIYFDKGKLLGGDWSGDKYVMDWNLVYDTRSASNAAATPFGEVTLEKWQARGHDIHSIIADPLFIAPLRDDFRLQPSSPALTMGFRPIDLSSVGPRKNR